MAGKRTGKTMTDDEAIRFAFDIGRSEIFDELKEIKERKKLFRYGHTYPFYLKAVRVSLVEMGYDEQWVDEKFRDVLEAVYLGSKPNRRDWDRGTLTKIRGLRKLIVGNMKWVDSCGRKIADD